MSDPVSMSLDDYIKSQKKTGKMSFGRGGGGGARRGRGGGPKTSNRGGGAGPAAQFGNRGNRNSFRGRKGRQPANNAQRRRGNGGFAGNRSRRFNQGVPNVSINRGIGGGAVMGQGLRQNRNNPNRRNRNRQMRRQRNNGGAQQVISSHSGPANFRYFQGGAVGSVATGSPKRNQAKRIRPRKLALNQPAFLTPSRNTKRTFMKLAAKQRVQRAKLLVSRKKTPVAGAGKIKSLMSTRVALGKNGFVTVRNTKAKWMERALVQMKIERAQQARNRTPTTQRTVSIAGPSGGGKRQNRNIRRQIINNSALAQPLDWNTSIVRTMTNELAAEMPSSQLNPEIQRKIAFIQSRSKRDRAPVMPDFRAPVSTSRMTLSDRFRLLSDQ